VKCMMWIVHSFIKQLIITLLQQFVKFRQVGRTETASLAATQDYDRFAAARTRKIVRTIACHLSLISHVFAA